MALRVKKVETGHVDGKGVFHKGVGVKKVKKVSKKRVTVKRAKKATTKKAKAKANSNPLPVGKYIKAKVKRMANGDVKVLITR
jgi:hypothetical protein